MESISLDDWGLVRLGHKPVFKVSVIFTFPVRSLSPIRMMLIDLAHLWLLLHLRNDLRCHANMGGCSTVSHALGFR